MANQVRSKYIWDIQLTGAILVLIGFLSPMAYVSDYGRSMYIWIWALSVTELNGYGTEAIFAENPEVLIPSIVCSISIFICICVLFASVRRYKRSIRDKRPTGNALLGASIATIISTISWMLSLEVAWPGPYNFWEIVNPHLGVFGLFIGSGISITGYVYARYIRAHRDEISLPKKKIYVSTPSTTEETIKNQLKFCPDCGNKLLSETQKFCVNCGFNLRNP
ncbi:MAG: zinc ribbon domain-containing protein [Candidatus Hermodarchaeota archaeon]